VGACSVSGVRVWLVLLCRPFIWAAADEGSSETAGGGQERPAQRVAAPFRQAKVYRHQNCPQLQCIV
jgi:hypothetical protein